MKKLGMLAVTSFALGAAVAMPTRQELSQARPLVAELMAPILSEYKEKTKTAMDVANSSVSFAEASSTEAAKFLFLRGAVTYYVRSGDFGKAADAVDAIKAKIKDVPPAEIVDVISSAFGRENPRKSPRLQAQLQLAKAQIKAMGDLRKLASQLGKVGADTVRRQYAEAFAIGGAWDKALAEFSKVSGNVGKLAKADQDGSSSAAELGDFWWNYETSYAGAEIVFRNRAAEYYRKAIAEGKVDGLKKTLVEQRLASLSLPDEDKSIDGRVRNQINPKPDKPDKGRRPDSGKGRDKDPTGLVARYSFAESFSPAVGSITPAMPDGAAVENGAITLRSGSPLVFPAGSVPLAPFTVQVWASATDKGMGADGNPIFKLAMTPDGKDDRVFWTWTNGGKKWASLIGAFGAARAVGHGTFLMDGKMHLYTVTGEKSGKGLALKFYQDDTCFGDITTKSAWKKSPMLILGGFVTPTYSEVRIYSRALSHAEIISAVNLGPDNLPETGK